MCAKRLERHEREKIVADLKRGNRTYKQISEKYSISLSTVHRYAEREGLTTRRTRTAPVEVPPDHTYDRDRRKATLDRIYKSIDDQVSKGGQSSKQLLDLARAAKEVNSARANEDKLVDPDALEEKRRDRVAGGQEALKLVDLNSVGTPRHLEVYFATLDLAIAREAGKHEEAIEAEERLKDACAGFGFKEAEVDVEAMILKVDRDFHAQLEREEARREARRRTSAKTEGEFNGQGLAR